MDGTDKAMVIIAGMGVGLFVSLAVIDAIIKVAAAGCA